MRAVPLSAAKKECCPIMQLTLKRFEDSKLGRIARVPGYTAEATEWGVKLMVIFPKLRGRRKKPTTPEEEFAQSDCATVKWCPFCGTKLEAD